MRPRLVDGPDLANVFALDSAIMPMLEKMEQVGMRIDVDRVRRTDQQFQDSLATIETQMESMIGGALYNSAQWPKGRFNPKSGPQVEKLLFTHLGIPEEGLKRTKKSLRIQVDKKNLEKLRDRHPIVPLLMEHTKFSKLRDGFTIPLPKWVNKQGRVIPTIKYTRIPSGRLAQTSPTLQNIPTRTKEGKLIRDCFIAGDGCKLISVDQSQIEMRVAAHISQDLGMLEIFWNGEDMHWKTAHGVYGLPIPADPDHPAPGELTKDQRAVCKNVGFGILYGITEKGLLDQILERVTDPEERKTWTLERCKNELIRGYFETYPGVRKMIDKFHRTAKLWGYIWDDFGRVRLTPGVRSADKYIAEKTLREVGNHPIQGTAQGTMKMGMADVWPVLEEIDLAGVTCRALVQIHDELIIEAEEGIADEVKAITMEKLSNAIELRVPVLCGGSIADSWGALK